MNIKHFLKTFGISSKDFAKKIGISPVSLSRYINGERIPEKNIINQPSLQKEVAALKSNLTSWMRQQGDQGIESELAVCERKGFSHRRCP